MCGERYVNYLNYVEYYYNPSVSEVKPREQMKMVIELENLREQVRQIRIMDLSSTCSHCEASAN